MPNRPRLNDPKEAAEYFARKLAFTCGPSDVNAWLTEKAAVNIVDVRAAEDFAKGHVPLAISLPKDRWQSFAGLARDRLNVVYCYTHVCHLAARAARLFAENGFPVMEMEGGIKAWREYHFLVEGAERVAAGQGRESTTPSLPH